MLLEHRYSPSLFLLFFLDKGGSVFPNSNFNIIDRNAYKQDIVSNFVTFQPNLFLAPAGGAITLRDYILTLRAKPNLNST